MSIDSAGYGTFIIILIMALVTLVTLVTLVALSRAGHFSLRTVATSSALTRMVLPEMSWNS